MTEPRSNALVAFGVTGDLAYKQIFPALHAMVRRGDLTMPVVGVARSAWTDDAHPARVRESIVRHGEVDEAAFAVWRVVKTVQNRPMPRFRYESGNWGPGQADRLMGTAGAWYNPSQDCTCR